MKKGNKYLYLLLLVFVVLFFFSRQDILQIFTGTQTTESTESTESTEPVTVVDSSTSLATMEPIPTQETKKDAFRYEDVPAYNGSPYITLNGDMPWFSMQDAPKKGTYVLSEWDSLGRCGPAKMLATKKSLPTEERGSTGRAKPSGWVQNEYKGISSSGLSALYNRSHLLMWALSGLTDNVKNLITGTRYFNVEGMLPVEKEVLHAVERGKDVFYQVTPIFIGDELLARGVLMEAMSTDGTFYLCRFAYNVQPGIHLDYSTGDNWAE